MHGLKLKKNSKANRSYLAHVSLSWLGSLTNPPGLSVRHDMCVVFMTNYFFSRRRYTYRQRDTRGSFVDLEDWSASFRDAHKVGCMHVYCEYSCLFVR
jgi:hypothetical protein